LPQALSRQEPKVGEVEVEVIYLSVDPYMRVGGVADGSSECHMILLSEGDSIGHGEAHLQAGVGEGQDGCGLTAAADVMKTGGLRLELC
jgi:hypothetical protein